VIGYKARELTHYISRIKSSLIMNQVTLVVIDQIRANMKITNRFTAPDDKGVGEFSSNLKQLLMLVHSNMQCVNGCIFHAVVI
jgi:hypothetical protein